MHRWPDQAGSLQQTLGSLLPLCGRRWPEGPDEGGWGSVYVELRSGVHSNATGLREGRRGQMNAPALDPHRAVESARASVYDARP